MKRFASRSLSVLLALSAALMLAFGVSWLVAMPNGTERGVWQHEANGAFLVLTPWSATLYQSTDVSCVENLVFPAHMGLVYAAEGAWVDVEGDRLELHVDGNLAPAIFNRVAALPAACHVQFPATPANTFNAMWAMMHENYAFFDLHGVDWAARKDLAPAQDQEMTPAALFALFQEALSGLDDGHVQILSEEFGFYSPAKSKGWAVGLDLDRDALNQIGRNTFGTTLISVPNTGLEYGLSRDGVGYILITRMSTDSRFGQLDSDVAEQGFLKVAQALQEAKVLIVDVRYNPGGDDMTAFAYAAHFATEPTRVLSKRTRKGDGWTDPVAAGVAPVEHAVRLRQPTILLTSQYTGSGAEIFTMAMREMPNVTVMGENTGGGLSDILGAALPNGWDFGLSNQEYRTTDGNLYEGAGIPPDLPVATTAEAILRGEDEVLTAALAAAISGLR